MNSNPLEQHDLPRLEAAAKELDAHIRERKPPRPRVRTLTVWAIALCLTVTGGYLLLSSVLNGRFSGPAMAGIGLLIAGLGIIISEAEQR